MRDPSDSHMPDPSQGCDILYGLYDRPPPAKAFLAALQHVLASFIGIITPTLIIGGILELGSEIPYLVSMALIVSGVGTFIQARRIGPVGSGLLCIQGTSFAFLASILAAGFIVKSKGGSADDILAMIFGICAVGAFVEIGLSFVIEKLKRIITPIVTGIVISIIGLSLIKVGMTDLAGGFGAEDLGSPHNLAVGGSVLVTVVILNRFHNPMIRMSAIMIGMIVGYIIALLLGMVDFNRVTEVPVLSLPVPFRYGFDFEFSVFIPIAIIYLVTAIETSGDLTANSMVSDQPVKGPVYIARIKGGVLGDGINSLIAATFNTFPNTTFSQNNGVIQLTGVASRYVAYFIAGFFVLLGLFPIIGALLQTLPKPVLGGATLIMFGTVAAAGMRIIASADLDRRDLMIMAVSFGLALGVDGVPEVISSFPEILQVIFGSSITVGGLTAIVLSLVLQKEKTLPDDTSEISGIDKDPDS
ncbi:nucleobase:cation symporter-2 family protein [Amphritea balenae]|nr:nucleobase:cation symporter-2 family protein [Amphritea balenae]GGK54920.1 xanthine permease [Amphritea balenae]